MTRFENIPDILELDHLTVMGDVMFGKNVTLRVSRPPTPGRRRRCGSLPPVVPPLSFVRHASRRLTPPPWFSGAVLQGTVIIIANEGERIDIPAGAILENKIVTGNLRIMEH